MPIPFLLGALGVAAGIVGAASHLDAKETNEKAQRLAERAQELYDEAKCSLERAQNKTEKELMKLGYQKKNVLDSSMKQFLKSYEKIKHIEVRESIGVNEISKFSIDQQGAIYIREMTDIYSKAMKNGATGAAAGAVVALAASGSLSIVTGGLATAGGALLAGNITAAAGIAGSALSFGAAMTPLSAIAAPVVLFTGISAGMQAEENLEKASAMYSQAQAAVEKMKVSETLCDAITERSEMFNKLLEDLNVMFVECSGLLEEMIRKKKCGIFKIRLNVDDFTEDELKLIAVTRALAGAVKAVIDTPIISKRGNISVESGEVYDNTVEKLSSFRNVVDEVKCLESRINFPQVNGYGKKQDYTKDVKWYQKVAEQGNADAQNNVGVCYANGYGVKQDYTEAVKWYRKAAEQGNAVAQNNVGVCYANGYGVKQDYTEAVKWYRKAAEQGNANAQCNLGICYYTGNGVEQNYTEEVKWYRKAAEQGHATAQYNLGMCYYTGNGVEQNYTEAVKWYRKAAEQGHVSAQFNCGGHYYDGSGVKQDYVEAVKWYRKAAEQGHARAQYNVGVCYANGYGVRQDKVEAVKWYRKAAKQGHEKAQKALKMSKSIFRC